MKIMWAVILSLGLHLVLTWGAGLLPNTRSDSNASNAVEVELVARNPENLQTIIQPEVPKNKQIESEDPAKLLSELKIRVEKQMQALRAGRTANRQPQALPRRDQRQTKSLDFFDQSYTSSQPTRPLDLNQGISSIGNAIDKSIPVGQMTLLNTDSGLFYSFYSRVEDRFRSRWESHLNRIVAMSSPEVFNQTANREWVTEAEIVLKPNGEFERAILLKSSGIAGFDKAATLAFAQARIFPNPPKQLIGPDNLIRLRYALNVYYSPPLRGKLAE